MDKQTQMNAGNTPSQQQQGQAPTTQRKKAETVQAGAAPADKAKQMQATQFTDWAAF